MSREAGTPRRALGAWLEELFAGARSEIDARGLRVRLEVGSGLQVEANAAEAVALAELRRMILVTIPDGCEIYLGSAPARTPVSRVGAGEWIARWQVSGAPDAVGGVTSLRPLPGGATQHAQSALARRLRTSFEATGWEYRLEPIDGDRELLVRVSCR